ncbi:MULTISPECIES: PDZ domain-containing protein [Cohnella]|uniref:PDZ domain-containing protein n=1 Tax=Cohnella TaxID=329857 RepID=UPI0009BC631C|nr:MULTISPECIES: PDZ domain-containing protein [Cohnella]MBN2980585.1 PDZ domain-containing protein [Cohnella algarum]
MSPWIDWLREAGLAAAGLFTLPYFYIAVLFAWWHARNGVVLQRQMFHVRMYGSLSLLASRTLAGLGAGLCLSLVGLGAGARLSNGTLLCIWLAMVVLALFRLRYICLAYAAGALGVVQSVLAWTGLDGDSSGAIRELLGIDVPGLLFLAGLLHVAEGALIRLQGAKQAVPLFLEGKRGKPVGAYSLSGVWPIPLLWLVPAAGADGLTLPWTPLFGLESSVSAWSLLAFPVLIGFTDRTTTRWPEEKARESGNSLLVYGALICLLAAGSVFWEPLAFVASLGAFVLHEGVLLLGRWREGGRQPVYAQEGRGLTILAVLPGTPAAEMGLQAGERIMRLNGKRVDDKEQLHDAMQLQAAFSKLEVVNREGHVKFAQRARYSGEHYQLGIILAPDEDADIVAAPRSGSIWQGLRQAGARRRHAGRLRAEEAARREAADASGETAAASSAAEPVMLLEAIDPREELAARLPAPPASAATAERKAPEEAGLPPRRSRR